MSSTALRQAMGFYRLKLTKVRPIGLTILTVVAAWGAIMWFRSIDRYDYLTIHPGGKAIGVLSNEQQVGFFISSTNGYGFGSMRTAPDFSPRFLLPIFEYRVSADIYIGIPYWMLIAPAAIIWSIKLVAAEERQRRCRAGRCEFCG
jgi:hypothetical protein